MSRLNVHHLPVLDGEQVVGVISTTDLVRFQSSNAVYLVSDIRKAPDVDTLIQASRKLPELQIHLVNSGSTADHIGEAITAVTDAISIRLLELAEAKLGPPPVAYVWMAGGSQARREQTSHSDQDNALMLADDIGSADEPYFEEMARFVNDGLNACGYFFCPGNVMASNPKWRQPLRAWRKYFKNWIERPQPMALMLSSVFFDLRAIHGTVGLLEELRRCIQDRARNNKIFLAFMAANALRNRPPIGFFRNFVLISGGDHDNTFDVKHRGIVPIVDLARVGALSAGIAEVNTVARLELAAEAKSISRDGAADLINALEFIATLRVRHQVRQLRSGRKADNFLSPDEISPLERGHLKDAFSLIDTMQEALSQRYQTGRLS
jgi:CBS domain-containing protein